MMQVLLLNGQRSGAVCNIKYGEIRRHHQVDEESVVIFVKKHKTLGKFVCKLTLSKDVMKQLLAWGKSRDSFLMLKQRNACNCDDDVFFCSSVGHPLPSNELSRLTRSIFGGTVSEMRKAQYYLVGSQCFSKCFN